MLLKKQLEQMAARIGAEENNMNVIMSALSTCSVLLKVSEESMSKNISDGDFQNLYARYLGIVNKVNSFYEKNQKYFGSNEKEKMNAILDRIKQFENELKEVNNQLDGMSKRILTLIKKLDFNGQYDVKENDGAVRNRIQSQNMKLQILSTEIEGAKQRLKKINTDIDEFEPNIDELIRRIAEAKDSYAEITAYYSELKRIQKGIEDDGYVDIVSFNRALDNMNQQSSELIARYDKILGDLSKDVDMLQKKIDAKRKK